MNRTTARGNRLGLILTGLLLLVLGGLALARGLRAFPQNWAPAGEPLVNGPVLTFFLVNSPWIWWAIAAVALIVALLGLRWLAVQGRGDSLGTLDVERGPDGNTSVSSGAVTHALSEDLAASPVIDDARATLAGTRQHPKVRLRVVADERVPMHVLLGELGGSAIPRMRDALGIDELTTVAKIGFTQTASSKRRVS